MTFEPNTDDDRLWVVVGPTASGKTSLAIELCERFDGEIVSADSVQVYRHFEIGTGKPSSEERARARHHLIDVIEPSEPMDAARFAELAELAIAEIRGRGKRPIVCGGTFLWVRALIHGLVPAPPAEAELRLAPNDFVRVSRALEVYELTGVRMSDWQAQHGFKTERHAARLLGVRREKDELDRRIRARCQAMLAAGWVDEARELAARGYLDTRPFASVGYKQVALALQSAAAIDADELELSIFRATRIFARRQRTWLRDQPVEWLEPESTKL